MTELKIIGVRKLGELLKVSKTTAADLAKQSWFPRKGPDGSWVTSEVTKAYADFKEGRLAPPTAPIVPLQGNVEVAPVGLDSDALRSILERENDPEKIATAAMQLMARAMATSGLSVKHVIALKMALEEARKGASGYLKLAQEKGELIKRDVAKSVIGQLARRAILLLERHEVELAARVESWFGDERFRALTSEERTREIRKWAQEKTYELRSIEAAEVEALVAAESKEQAK